MVNGESIRLLQDERDGEVFPLPVLRRLSYGRVHWQQRPDRSHDKVVFTKEGWLQSKPFLLLFLLLLVINWKSHPIRLYPTLICDFGTIYILEYIYKYISFYQFFTEGHRFFPSFLYLLVEKATGCNVFERVPWWMCLWGSLFFGRDPLHFGPWSRTTRSNLVDRCRLWLSTMAH